MIEVFKILVYLGTIPFIAFWLWIGGKALLGKVSMSITFFGKKIQSRWGIVLVSVILIIKNALLLSSAAAVDALAIILMDKWQEIIYFWADIIAQISRWNQPWFWDPPTGIPGIDGRGFFCRLFCHTLSTCAYIQV